MKLTLADLNAGIYWWLTVKLKWPRDFHDSDYHELYDIRRNGLTETWWGSTVDRLVVWYAIRPKRKAEIKERGLKVIERMQQIYSGILDSGNDEPVFLNFEWSQISDLYDLLTNIKGSKSPVFPSKLAHFIFPKLFMIMDNEATDIQPYDVFWRSLRKAWHDFDERDTAKQVLIAQIAQHSREVHKDFPLEIKIIELCSIGGKHKSIQDIVAPKSPSTRCGAKSRTGGIMTPTQFKATVRRTGRKDEPLRLTVDIKIAEANGLPYHSQDSSGASPKFDLLVGNDYYQAFFRKTDQYVYITTPLTNVQNREVSLTEILSLHGYQPNQPVLLNREQKGIRLSVP